MDDFQPRYYVSYCGLRPLSAAGAMLERLDAAEQAIQQTSDITDELRCALRRADIKERFHGHR